MNRDKQYFGRSQFNNPCPPDGPAPCAKTGQTGSDYPGDDGDLERGVEWPNPRFTDNLDGTVTDNLTGLIWLRRAHCWEYYVLDWYQSLDGANALQSGYCGLTDGSTPGEWRMPNRIEMLSILDMSRYNPALPNHHPFLYVQNQYWTSTTDLVDGSKAFYVRVVDGESITYEKADPFAVMDVWPVRGGH